LAVDLGCIEIENAKNNSSNHKGQTTDDADSNKSGQSRKSINEAPAKVVRETAVNTWQNNPLGEKIMSIEHRMNLQNPFQICSVAVHEILYRGSVCWQREQLRGALGTIHK
jgi:hypothetical protein